MSMCLYLKAGSEIELSQLARDGEALANIAMSKFEGGGGALTPIDEFTMARLSRKMQEKARLHGPEVAKLMKTATEHLQQRMEELARLHGPQVAELMKTAKERLQQSLAGSQVAKAGVSTGPAANDVSPGSVLDLHKSWHILHFLFTGSAGEAAAPGGSLLAGGREIGEDLG